MYHQSMIISDNIADTDNKVIRRLKLNIWLKYQLDDIYSYTNIIISFFNYEDSINSNIENIN